MPIKVAKNDAKKSSQFATVVGNNMLKLMCGVLVVVLTLVLLSSVHAEDIITQQEQEESVFVRNFKQLHQEPPPPPPAARNRANVVTLTITQKLDHFNESDDRTWQMRYMSNDEFYEEGGPFFIWVGGEWAISSGYLTGGHTYDMAKEHNGYLYYTEHRYYGESHPTSDLTTANLKYLHVRQALADLAHFIRDRRENVPGATNSKVILVGGSYSATMVTWFKKEYPDLATGCWASSAPLFAKADFVEYKEVTGQSIRLVGGDSCYNRIQNGIAELEALFANKRGAEVRAMLKLCSSFDETNDLDVWTLFSEISDIFAGIVQTHNDGNIQNACQQIMAGVDDISGVASYILSRLGSSSCNDLRYITMLDVMMDSTYSSNIMRQWMYQTCNEYGWYQTSGSNAQPFGTKFPLALYAAMCHDVYNGQFTNEIIHEKIAATNEHFGGLNPGVENVYMTHGQLDPWHAMGKQDGELTTIIPMYAHCKDFGSISDRDTPEMRASKEKIAQLVRQWLSESSQYQANIASRLQ